MQNYKPNNNVTKTCSFFLGYYMYIEASNKRRGDNAIIERIIPLSGDTPCLAFYYHMIGYYIGTLNVYVGNKKVFSKTGNTGFSWNKAEIPLNVKEQDTVGILLVVFFLYIYISKGCQNVSPLLSN